MKKSCVLIIPAFLFFCKVGLGQTNTTKSTNSATQVQKNQIQTEEKNTSVRKNSATIRTESHPLPYDVNDKYMGRKVEFINMMNVSELPTDFPVYEKQWDLKKYNAVVEAYFINHKDLLKEKVKQKLSNHN